MAKLNYIGAAQAVSQIETITLGGTWSPNETAKITINGKFVEFAGVGSPTPATMAAGLQALAEASNDPEFSEIAWSVDAAVVTATSLAGVPVTITVSEDSASGTIGTSTTQAASGPNHWSNAANWSTGSVPTTNDEVFVESDVSILYGLPSGLTLDKLVQTAGRIGLPPINPRGYPEYRPTYLTITCPILNVTARPRRTRIDLASSAAVVTVDASSTAPVELLLNNATSEVNVLRGRVLIADDPSEVSSVGTVRVGDGATAVLGPGLTLVTLTSAGTVEASCSATTVNVEKGQASLKGSGTVGTLNVLTGTCNHGSVGTITTANIGPGTLDCRSDIRPKTITNLTLNRNGIIRDPYRVVTYTNKIAPGADVDLITAQ